MFQKRFHDFPRVSGGFLTCFSSGGEKSKDMINYIYDADTDILLDIQTNTKVPHTCPTYEIFMSHLKLMKYFDLVQIIRVFDKQHYKVSKRHSCNQYIVDIYNI